MTEQQQAPSTRERIQQIALDLFGEQGYDKTSLREIAERLDVTKAALYYHFKSKEAILESVLEDYLTEVDDLVAWAGDQPPDAATRTEVIERYAAIVGHRMKAMRFLQQGSAGMKDSEIGLRFRASMKGVHELFRAPDAPLVDQVRALAAVIAIHVGTMSLGVPNSAFGEQAANFDPVDVQQAVVEVASELVAKIEA